MKQITLAELPELVQNLINQTLKTGELLIAIIESVRYTPIDPPKSPLKRGTLKISGSPLFKGGWGGSKMYFTERDNCYTITQNGIPFAAISPIQKKSLLQTLSTLEPLDEDFADVDEGLLPLDDIEFEK